jgi:hypothetical protein
MTATSNRTYILSQSTRSLTTNIQSCIIENLEALEIEKNILNPLRQHCEVIMYEYIFVYIVLPSIIIITIIDFFLPENIVFNLGVVYGYLLKHS